MVFVVPNVIFLFSCKGSVTVFTSQKLSSLYKMFTLSGFYVNNLLHKILHPQNVLEERTLFRTITFSSHLTYTPCRSFAL